MIKTFHQHVAASQHGATEANESESMRALVDKLMEAEDCLSIRRRRWR